MNIPQNCREIDPCKALWMRIYLLKVIGHKIKLYTNYELPQATSDINSCDIRKKTAIATTIEKLDSSQ